MTKSLQFFGLVAATLLVMFGVRFVGVDFNTSQILSVVIFSTFIYGTLLFGDFRLAFAFGGIALLLGLNLLTIQQFTESANLKVIVFLIGMFLVIGFLEENQFFEYVVGKIVAAVGPRPKLLLLVMMVMATLSAALVDEVTSILFMTGAMLTLTNRYRLNPVPFIIMLVFGTNIGSSMSSIGNPIGVMIALGAGFSFMEFVRWSAPIALVVSVVTWGICRWWFADAFRQFGEAVMAEGRRKELAVQRRTALAGGGAGASQLPERTEDEIAEDAFARRQAEAEEVFFEGEGAHQNLWISAVVFGFTILLLVTHSVTEHMLGLKEGTMMVGASLTMGCVVLMLRQNKARELLERRVDWWTLTFFMMLFASVGTLEHTGVTSVVAQKLITSTGGNQTAVIQIVGWATGWLSAFLDNVLAVATFMPVVEDIRRAHAAHAMVTGGDPRYPETIYWMMLFGGTFMGNATVIGSTANIIAVGVLEKRGHGTIKFGYWMKIGIIVGLVGMAVATILMELQIWMFGAPMIPPPPPVGG